MRFVYEEEGFFFFVERDSNRARSPIIPMDDAGRPLNLTLASSIVKYFKPRRIKDTHHAVSVRNSENQRVIRFVFLC